MFKKSIFIAFLALLGSIAYCQTPRVDSLAGVDDDLKIDTSVDYDELMDELASFIDSILAPRSYFLASVALGQGYYNFSNKTNNTLSTSKRMTLSPTLAYYDRNGLGITMTGNLVSDSQRLNLYQVTVSPTYDYLEDRNFALGVGYVRYFTKDSLRFYVSPLQNEINAYFLWRKPWLKPGIAANFGWGSRTEYKKRLEFIERLQIRRLLVTTTEESIADFSLTGSLRHDFYWLNVFSRKGKEHIRLSPQFAFSAGTQKFGFNQTTGSYGITRNNPLYNAGNISLDETMRFQPLAATLYLRSEYSFGKFFLQPQIILDYYFPAREKNLTALVSVNMGFAF
ncbi:MAG: hypothetical protein H7Y42_09255 [Chitinophagaceae bacterium]|nr:hypothetical protein [Chitinophagaceae bacterium]